VTWREPEAPSQPSSQKILFFVHHSGNSRLVLRPSPKPVDGVDSPEARCRVTTRPNLLPGFILLGLMTLTAFGGLIYGWWRWKPEYFKQLPLWRRVLSSVGLLAVSLQALLFLLSWTKIGRDPVLIGHLGQMGRPNFFGSRPLRLGRKRGISLVPACRIRPAVRSLLLNLTYPLKTASSARVHVKS